LGGTVSKIQRHTYPCGCVVEQEVLYDNALVIGMNITDPQYLLINDVCDGHKPLASKEITPKHAQLSPHVLDLIEATKARNLKQVDDLLAQPNLRLKTRKELEQCRLQVIQHNQNITEEWQELVTLPHAFDQHIHEQILKEQNG
jgi:hypothetical protein